MHRLDEEFDRQFKRTTRLIWLVFCIRVVVGLAVLGGIGFVAFHFLQKIW